MRNLKRVLSLALASAMLLGMMVIGAGAADTTKKPLTDLDKVTNKDAVNLMVDLKVITGKPDGSYAPAETVDRATMSTLIYKIMTGETSADAFKGASSLADVKGTWAEGFINYCSSLKIVSGDGTNFYPTNKVTVAQAAKMLLVAIGYDAELSKYQGDAMWSVNIMKDAKKAGIVDGVDQAATDELTRDNAAKMVYNTLFADTVVPNVDRDQGVAYLKGYDPSGLGSLGTQTYKLVKYTGVVVANEFANIFGGDAADAGKTIVNSYITADLNKGDISATNETVKVSTDVALLGQEVNYYTHGSDKTLSTFVTATGKTKEYTWTDDAITLTKFKTNNGLDNSSSIKYATNYNVGSYTPTAKDGSRFIDSNADGRIDFVLKASYLFSKVTKIDSTNVTITGLGTRKIADVSGSADLKKDDYVNYTVVGASGKASVAKAPEVTGTVTSLKSGPKAVINGTTYTVAADAGKATLEAPAVSMTSYVGSLTLSKAVAGIFYLNQAGEAAVYVPTEETADTTVLYAYVTGIQVSSSFGTKTVEAKVVLADGTQETLTVVDNNTASNNADTDGLWDKAVDAYGTPAKETAIVGVYPYTLNKDGAMVGGEKIVNAATHTKGAYTAGKPAMALDNNVDTDDDITILMDSNTVVLFYSKSGDKEIISSVKGVDNVPTVGDNVAVTYVPAGTGKTFVPFVFVGAVGKAETDAKYAYALSNAYASQTAKGYEYNMVVSGEKVALTTENLQGDMQIGNVYTYTEDTDGIATLALVDGVNTFTGVIAAVSGKYVTLKGSTTPVELASEYTVDDLTATDADGAIVPGTGDLTANSKIVYVTSAGKLVKAYVINDGKAATFELGNANKGALLATDGYTITMTGTLAKAAANDIQSGSAEGHYIAYKFTAPAGVSATGASVKIATSTAPAADGVFTFGTLQPYASFDGFANGATSVKVVAGPMGVTSSAFNTKAVKVEITWSADYVETYIINVSAMTPGA